MIKFLSILLTVLALNSCSSGLTSKPIQLILLFKDKDGIYQFDPTTEKEKVIYKATEKQVFLDEPYKLINDTLTFGLDGELTYTDTTDHSVGEKYFKDYVSVDLRLNKSWLSKKILYEVVGHDSLKIITKTFNSKKKLTSQSDSACIYKGSSSTYKGITYNDFRPRFFSKSTLGNKSVFSFRGSIYLTNNFDTTKLVDYKGNFDPKFGSGYFQPQFDPKRQYVVFRYLPGFMTFTEKPSLLRVDLGTKKISRIKKGDYNEPTFSKDGQFLLFNRNERQGKNNTWISDIYILDLKSKKEWKIGEAYSASWKE